MLCMYSNSKLKKKQQTVGMQMEREQHACTATYKSIPSLLSHLECSDNLYGYQFQGSPKDVVT